MKRNSVSIKDISDLSGVSVATVSRVINKKGRYSKETAEKVNKIIEKYNYKPNQIAVGLRTRNTQMIGMIVPDITNEFFAKIVRQVEKEFFYRGYSIFICNSDENLKSEKKYLHDLMSKGVLALIYVSGSTTKNKEKLGVPTVFIDREPYADADVVVISSDNLMGGKMAAQELLLKGCKNPLLLRDERKISTQEDREKGFLTYLINNGFVKKDIHIVKTKIDYFEAKERMIAYFRNNSDVDGVFATTDWMALAAMDALKELEVNVPKDIKIIGYDDISISRYCYLPITTIKQDTYKMAILAVESIINTLNKKPVQKRHIIPVELITRKTT